MYRITLFLISLLFYSCSKDNNVFCESMIHIEKFPEEKTSRGKLMADTLYFTYNIFSFEDNVISINQKKAKHLFQVFDNKFTKKLSEFGNFGRARNDFYNNFFLHNHYKDSNNNTIIWISDDTQGKIKAINLNKSIEKSRVVIDRELDIPTATPMATLVANDSILVSLDLVQSNINMITQNTKSNKILSTETFYQTNATGNTQTAFLGMWTITPDGQKIINCMSSFNQINMCDINGKNRKSVSYKDAPLGIENVLNSNNIPKYYYYGCVICDSKYIYAIYHDVDYLDIGKPEKNSQLHVFDYEFNAIKLINLDKNIQTITFGDNPNSIYGICAERNVWKFNI